MQQLAFSSKAASHEPRLYISSSDAADRRHYESLKQTALHQMRATSPAVRERVEHIIQLRPPAQLEFEPSRTVPAVPPFHNSVLKRAHQLAKRDVALGLRYGVPKWVQEVNDDMDFMNFGMGNRSLAGPGSPFQQESPAKRERQHHNAKKSRRKEDRHSINASSYSHRTLGTSRRSGSRKHGVRKAISSAASRIRKTSKRATEIQAKPEQLEELDCIPSRDIEPSPPPATEEVDAGAEDPKSVKLLREQVLTILADVRQELQQESKSMLEKEVRFFFQDPISANL